MLEDPLEQVPVTIVGLRYIPVVKFRDSLGRMIVAAATRQGVRIRNGDVVVVAQKIVSKAEKRFVSLSSIKPSKKAKEIARAMKKDPRHVEVILRETRRVVRRRGSHLIVQTRHGLVCANAGVDKSNVEGRDVVSLLPKDPDRSARQIRAQIRKMTRRDVVVIVSDTFGRPWRMGQTNVAIGLSGMRPWMDYRGTEDMFGYQLSVTVIAVADELAGAAELVMNKSSGVPVAVIRGFPFRRGRGSARQLIRPARQDLFR
jgi:coenzyme F420-0:L-glutamate ligase/coenzyme F420-1:gamma-L-glutamate ligase